MLIVESVISTQSYGMSTGMFLLSFSEDNWAKSSYLDSFASSSEFESLLVMIRVVVARAYCSFSR